MATQSQLNTTIQSYRNIYIKIEVLDFNYYILDEISGLATSAQFSINADSDIRRSCNINMILKSEYENDKLYNDLYWKAGNPFWFDKYLKIYVGIKEIATNEIVWNKQGIYLINQPSISYDASINELRFEGVDLMSKLTGLRNGNLEGVDYVIDAGVNIISVIRSTLEEQNFFEYVLYNPPQYTTPYEIRINAGGTSYDILKELRDINPDWEMFFDVDGVFYFQQIKGSDTQSVNIVPDVTAEILDVLDIDFTLDTSFDEVKNYVEVYGGAIEAEYTPTSVRIVNNNLLVIDIGENYDPFKFDGVSFYSFILGSIEEMPSLLSHPIINIAFNVSGDRKDITLNHPILYNNTSYAFRIYKATDELDFNIEFLGYTQPFGLAWDNNESSPFYVGNNINEWNLNRVYMNNDICYYNNKCYKSKQDNNVNNIPLNTSYWELFFDVSTGVTDVLYNKPRFERQVRIVLSGGEYDNIYSNDLAMQRAKYEIYLRSKRHDNLSLTVVPIYWLDVNQIIEYQLPNEDSPSYWLVKEISTDFSVDGTQTITAIRCYTGQ